MPVFEMIKYHNKKYPADIPLRVEEIAGNFDVRSITPAMPYSLHTEYSYGKRDFRNEHLKKYPAIVAESQNGIPMLWYNEKWAEEFAHFILDITSEFAPPKYIEIHPPFSDYTESLSCFLKWYKVFEEIVLSEYTETQILIENRCGSNYKGGAFAVSSAEQMLDLSRLIACERLSLRITLDIPQLYTAHKVTNKHHIRGLETLTGLMDIREYIAGVHLWGKRLTEKGRRQAHYGDLNNYFFGNQPAKSEFLAAIYSLFDDDLVRNMVLEVNSENEDMLSIISDLRDVGFTFV